MRDTAQVAVVTVDVHDGFSVLQDSFTHDDEVDTDITERLVPAEVVPNAPEQFTEELIDHQKRKPLWRRAVARVVRAAKAALAAVGTAVQWLTAGARRSVERRFYRGRHHTLRNVHGRDRSTAEFVGAVQRYAREPRGEEGHLAFDEEDTFVGWIALSLESMQRYQAALHPDGRHRFICS